MSALWVRRYCPQNKLGWKFLGTKRQFHCPVSEKIVGLNLDATNLSQSSFEPLYPEDWSGVNSLAASTFLSVYIPKVVHNIGHFETVLFRKLNFLEA